MIRGGRHVTRTKRRETRAILVTFATVTGSWRGPTGGWLFAARRSDLTDWKQIEQLSRTLRVSSRVPSDLTCRSALGRYGNVPDRWIKFAVLIGSLVSGNPDVVGSNVLTVVPQQVGNHIERTTVVQQVSCTRGRSPLGTRRPNSWAVYSVGLLCS